MKFCTKSLLLVLSLIVLPSFIFAQAGPDLEIVYLEITKEGEPSPIKRPMILRGGDMVDLRFDVYNHPVFQGSPTGTAVGYRVDVYLSQDGAIHEDASVGAERGNFNWTFVNDGGLLPGDTHRFHYVVHIPGNLPGDYFLTAEVTITHGPDDVNHDNDIYEPRETAKLSILPANFAWTHGVSMDPAGNTGDGISDHPSISDDNRYVAFASEATDLVPGLEMTNGFRDIYVRDMFDGSVRWVSTATGAGGQGNGSSDEPRISGDGRYVVFESAASNLVQNDTNGWSDIFLHDLETRKTILISIPDRDVSNRARQANGASFLPTISRDGRYVVYESSATNLVSTSVQSHRDVYLYEVNWDDPAQGSTRLISRGLNGPSNDVSNVPYINADGTRVVFETMATNIVPEGGNNFRQIIAYDIGSGNNRLISRGLDGSLGNEPSETPTLSGDGRYAAYGSWADNLVHHPMVGTIRFDNEVDPDDGEWISISDGDQEVVFEFDNDGEMDTPDAVRVALGGPDPFLRAQGVIALFENPEDGATVTISDGYETFTFEFFEEEDSEGGEEEVPRDFGDNIPVEIHPDFESVTRGNLRDAIFEAGLALIVGIDGGRLLLMHLEPGGRFNLPITRSLGGFGDSNYVWGLRAGRDDVEQTMRNLIEAIYDAGLHYVALDNTVYTVRLDNYPSPVLSLTHRDPSRRWENAGMDYSSYFDFMVSGMSPFTSRFRDVYLYDFDTDEIEMVSVNRSGVQGAGGEDESTEPSMSNDGNVVSFRSLAQNLLPPIRIRSDGYHFVNPLIWGYSHRIPQSAVYYRDRSEPSVLARLGIAPEAIGVNQRASVDRFGFEGYYVVGEPQVPSSRHGVVSNDGRFIVFASDGHNAPGFIHGKTNLVSPDNNEVRDVLYHDRRSPGLPPEQIGHPPTVAIVYPGEPITVQTGSQIAVTASAFDSDGTIEELEIYANGELIVREQNPGSHVTAIWDVPTFPGTYLIYAAGTDDHGNRRVSDSVAVTVETATVASPETPGFELSATSVRRGQEVMLSVTPAPGGSQVVSAEFYANGLLIGQDDEEPFGFVWTPTVTGTYDLFAVVTDAAGNTAPSAVRRVEVTAVGGIAPTVSIVSPAEELTVTNRSVWPLVARATDSDGEVTSVEFFLGGRNIGQGVRERESSNYRLNFDFRNTITGAHNLIAVARDNGGNVTSSAPVVITVVGASGDPQMTATLFVDGGSIVNGVKTFQINDLIQARVNATSSAGAIDSVEFFLNGNSALSVEGRPNPVEEPPFTYLGEINVAGNYNMYAVVTDTFGNTIVTDPVPINVTGTPTGQMVTITSPAEGSRYTLGVVGEDLTGAPPIPFRIRIDPQVDGVTQVEYLVNGEVVTTLNSGIMTRFNWVPDRTGQLVLTARVTDSRGRVHASDAVTVFVLPLGSVVGNPADPGNHIGFVTQTYLDLLRRSPTAFELKTFSEGLSGKIWTRGEVAAKIMTNSDFDIVTWVIATYLTVLRDFPTVDQLHDGIELLETGEGETPDEDVVLGADTPALLPLLVQDILASEEFWIKHLMQEGKYSSGMTMDTDELLELLHYGKTARIRDERLALMDSIGRVNYLTQLAVEKYPDKKGPALRGALILMLLDRDIIPGELAGIPSNLAQAAQLVVTSQQYMKRFSDEPGFFGPTVPSLSGMHDSTWFGAFNDSHFDITTGSGWIAHEEHGWLYVTGPGYPNGIWYWDHIQQKWIWTRHDYYPRLYSDNPGEWLFYHEGGSPNLRVFQSHNGQDWSDLYQVTP